MCYNCGCGNPNDDMGHPENITNATFDQAAKAEGQTREQALMNTLELLQRQVQSATSK